MTVRIHRLISTCLGIGYIPKGGGTVAALVCCIAWYLAFGGGNDHIWPPLLITLSLLALGTYSSGKVEPGWGKDSYRVVIDEWVGMSFTLLFVPVQWPYLLTGLLLFRAFDIVKPFYVRRMEELKGGWGVMMDDVLAGIYANLVLQLVVVAVHFVKTR
ncbi:MAG TPA: phosphatidylglycerophosphatase A [Puia sp.]|nr:phosphatidylglycerophosphatase A [Puia sp.]